MLQVTRLLRLLYYHCTCILSPAPHPRILSCSIPRPIRAYLARADCSECAPQMAAKVGAPQGGSLLTIFARTPDEFVVVVNVLRIELMSRHERTVFAVDFHHARRVECYHSKVEYRMVGGAKDEHVVGSVLPSMFTSERSNVVHVCVETTIGTRNPVFTKLASIIVLLLELAHCAESRMTRTVVTSTRRGGATLVPSPRATSEISSAERPSPQRASMKSRAGTD